MRNEEKTSFFNVNGFKVANIKSLNKMASFGIGVWAGARYENFNNAGVAHFAEHMFFKGTENISWEKLDREFAKCGANQNAFTSNDMVMYYASFPEENNCRVIPLLNDMFFNATFPSDEMEKERKVIMEEKRRSMDDPNSFFHNMIGDSLFQWWIGHDVLGEMDTIEGISRYDIIDFLNKRCNFETIMFIYSGNLSDNSLREILEKNIPSEHRYARNGEKDNLPAGLWRNDIFSKQNRIKMVVKRDDITQSNVSMMIGGIPANNSQKYASKVLCNIVGGGMYSMLFSRIRQELGLCYSINMYDYDISYPDYNILSINGGTEPSNVEVFIDESEKIMDYVLRNGVNEELFECAKADLLSRYLRSNETAMGRLMFFSSSYMSGELHSLEDTLEKIRNVSLSDCNEVSQKLFNGVRNWAVMYPSSF